MVPTFELHNYRCSTFPPHGECSEKESRMLDVAWCTRILRGHENLCSPTLAEVEVEDGVRVRNTKKGEGGRWRMIGRGGGGGGGDGRGRDQPFK